MVDKKALQVWGGQAFSARPLILGFRRTRALGPSLQLSCAVDPDVLSAAATIQGSHAACAGPGGQRRCYGDLIQRVAGHIFQVVLTSLMVESQSTSHAAAGSAYSRLALCKTGHLQSRRATQGRQLPQGGRFKAFRAIHTGLKLASPTRPPKPLPPGGLRETISARAQNCMLAYPAYSDYRHIRCLAYGR